MNRLRRFGGPMLLCGLLISGVLAPLAGAPAPATSPPLHGCDVGLVVDGLLVCGPLRPASLAEVCGRPVWSDHALFAGDAVDRRICDAAQPVRGVAGWARIDPAELAALGVPIDVNTASESDLRSLPGIGPALAQRIEEGRPYEAPRELLRVRGVGVKTLARMQSRVVLRPPLIAAR